jgi:hypothetical protein
MYSMAKNGNPSTPVTRKEPSRTYSSPGQHSHSSVQPARRPFPRPPSPVRGRASRGPCSLLPIDRHTRRHLPPRAKPHAAPEPSHTVFHTRGEYLRGAFARIGYDSLFFVKAREDLACRSHRWQERAAHSGGCAMAGRARMMRPIQQVLKVKGGLGKAGHAYWKNLRSRRAGADVSRLLAEMHGSGVLGGWTAMAWICGSEIGIGRCCLRRTGVVFRRKELRRYVVALW